MTGKAEIGESRSWTDCDRDFKSSALDAGRFFVIFIFCILQERAAGVGCFSHVWSLLSGAMLFSAMQRGWLHARENGREIKIEERQREL